MNPIKDVIGKKKPIIFDRGLLKHIVESFAAHSKTDYESAHRHMISMSKAGLSIPGNGCKHCDNGWIRFETDWMGYTYEKSAACNCKRGQRWLAWSKDGRRYKPYTQFHSLETAQAGIGVRLTRPEVASTKQDAGDDLSSQLEAILKEG